MYHISTMRRSNFLSTCIPNAVANYLLFQYWWSLCLRSITTPWQDWCMWVLRWAGERDRLPGCTLWKLTKLEPNIQCIRLPMRSNGNCGLVVQRCALPIEIWTTDRQDIRSDICVEADLNDSDVINWTVVCVCCTQLKFSSEQLTDRIKGHVSGPTDETKEDLNDNDQWPVMLSTELNCVCFRYKVVHSGNWQFYSSHTGCKIRWSGD